MVPEGGVSGVADALWWSGGDFVVAGVFGAVKTGGVSSGWTESLWCDCLVLLGL